MFLPCIVHWDKQFWPNDPNWASVFKSCKESEWANPGWYVRLGGSNCFVGSVSATAAQQFLDNIKYYISPRHCWSLMPGDLQSAGGLSSAHCRDPSQIRKWSVWFVCFWMAQSFLLHLDLGTTAPGNKGAGSKGEGEGAEQIFGSEDCCTSREMCSFKKSSGSQDCRGPVIIRDLLWCKGGMWPF